jgi:hypothetical protein
MLINGKFKTAVAIPAKHKRHQPTQPIVLSPIGKQCAETLIGQFSELFESTYGDAASFTADDMFGMKKAERIANQLDDINEDKATIDNLMGGESFTGMSEFLHSRVLQFKESTVYKEHVDEVIQYNAMIEDNMNCICGIPEARKKALLEGRAREREAKKKATESRKIATTKRKEEERMAKEKKNDEEKKAKGKNKG